MLPFCECHAVAYCLTDTDTYIQNFNDTCTNTLQLKMTLAICIFGAFLMGMKFQVEIEVKMKTCLETFCNLCTVCDFDKCD